MNEIILNLLKKYMLRNVLIQILAKHYEQTQQVTNHKSDSLSEQNISNNENKTKNK